jgi:hypothetical protein
VLLAAGAIFIVTWLYASFRPEHEPRGAGVVIGRELSLTCPKDATPGDAARSPHPSRYGVQKLDAGSLGFLVREALLPEKHSSPEPLPAVEPRKAALRAFFISGVTPVTALRFSYRDIPAWERVRCRVRNPARRASARRWTLGAESLRSTHRVFQQFAAARRVCSEKKSQSISRVLP